MPNKKRVVVAMSGGVDSSTALAILKEEGYECIGISMQLWDYSKNASPSAGSCCSLDDIYDARRVADSMNVPFYVVNMQDVFSKEVVDYFIQAYSSGTTPNPCVKCNQILKFDVLLKKAVELEAGFLATGHYARIVRGKERYHLYEGADKGKDQSYFLFTMTQMQLSRVLFPVGGLTKTEVRAKAAGFGLKISEKEESQEICFVEEPRYTQFLSDRMGKRPGEIVDTAGKVLGAHDGIFNYTIGQRKGLGLSGGPFYVIRIDTEENRIVVGREDELYATGLIARNVNWIDPEARSLALNGGLVVTVKIRYRHVGAEATITATPDGRTRITFKEPQKSVTPGQAAVFYRGEEVLGGGWIETACG